MSENLLSHEVSPYLLQHKDNPVHWRPWGPEALAEAKAANKPILLSVGYAACHWCHVMAHESFEDPETAAVMNRLFVNIKVDREERPDIDQIYMTALHATGEQGGWPLTMFLTPAGDPIWGGTYFPKESRYGSPAFVTVLNAVARLYHEEPDKIAANRLAIAERLVETPTSSGTAPDRRHLDAAADRLVGIMDPVHGGPRGEPKFPNASLLECLWRAGMRTGEPRYFDAVLLTLRSIASGGVYDQIGGGFARYATDGEWLIPHFEKMLYDNAQLIELMTYAFAATGDRLFAECIEQTVGWLEREMLTPPGAFASSLDADSEGKEGKFYTWSQREIIDVLGTADGSFFSGVYEVSPAGNWEGVNILNRRGRQGRLSDAEEARLAVARAKLLERRATRVRPATDDKILADWNGLTVAALALASAVFDRPEWLARAAEAFRFVTRDMAHDGRLAHAWRDGRSTFPGLATDYAAAIKAALALHAATLDDGYLDDARSHAAALRNHHWDGTVPGYFLSADDAEALIIRPKSTADEATPSATSLMAANLIRLWHLTGDDDFRRDADDILAANAGAVANNLFSTTGLLNALDLRLGAVEVAILTPDMASAAEIVATVRRHWTPSTILSVHRDGARLPASHPAAGKEAIAGQATAYVCRGETCSLPVTDADALATELKLPPISSSAGASGSDSASVFTSFGAFRVQTKRPTGTS